MEGGAQRNPEAFPRHVYHIGVWTARRLFEEAADPAGEVYSIPVLLDNHAGRPMPLQNDAFHLFREVSVFRFRLVVTGPLWAADLSERKLDRRTRQTLLA